ncbi:MFS transporter [Pseudarthrobacter phenanthrenivorans]|uniref:MFS transporter n=1 Tax=Pseudarthrobacter phenanthrenivorans TaxID=361575 RepID=UPI00344E8A62
MTEKSATLPAGDPRIAAETLTLEGPYGPQTPVSTYFMLTYFFAQTAAWIGILAPVVVSLAIRVGQVATPEEKAAQLGIILGVGAFGALVAAPAWGAISDRTTARVGRRKLWMMLGAAMLLAGLLTMAFSPNLLVLGIGWFICQVGSNANQAALNAVLPDVVPDHQRGRTSGLLGLSITVAVLAAVFITQYTTSSPILMFLVPWLLIPVSQAMFFPVFKDKPADTSTMPKYSVKEFGRTFWVNPVRHPDFAWAFFSRFFVFLGTAFLQSYQVYFLTDHLQIGLGEVAGMIFLSTLINSAITIIVSMIGGWMSDRFRRRKPFVWAAAIITGVGLLVIGMSSTFDQFLIGAAIMSLGSGLYYAVDLALVAMVLPDPNDAAKDMGVFQIANSLPQSLAPAIAPFFLAIGTVSGGNYPVLFIAATVFAVIGAFLIIPVKKTH